MDSILNSVKAFCGILPTDDAFDSELLMAINSVMVVLNQLGVGPETPFVVDNTSTWSEFLGDTPVGCVREYVNMRSRMLFDPPSGTYVKQAYDEYIKEYEWRILAEVDKKDYESRSVESE